MDAFDEMRGPKGMMAGAYQALAEWLYATPPQLLDEKRREAEILLRRTGITFNVYGEEAGSERLILLGIIPRSPAPAEWTKLSKGLEQRVRGLDAFLGGIYHEQDILKAVKIPSAKVLDNALYRPEMQDIEVPAPAPLKPWTDASSITSVSITSLPPPPAWARMAPGPWEE